MSVSGGASGGEGLAYQDDSVTPVEERELLDLIEPFDFREIEMRGQTAKRTVRHFRLGYSVTFRTLKRPEGGR